MTTDDMSTVRAEADAATYTLIAEISRLIRELNTARADIKACNDEALAVVRRLKAERAAARADAEQLAETLQYLSQAIKYRNYIIRGYDGNDVFSKIRSALVAHREAIK